MLRMHAQLSPSGEATIFLCAGPVGVAPSAVRRGMLVLLQSLGPYLVDFLPMSESSSFHRQPQPYFARALESEADDPDEVPSISGDTNPEQAWQGLSSC